MVRPNFNFLFRNTMSRLASMASISTSTIQDTIDKLYSTAIDPNHAYHVSPQTAQSLLSTVVSILKTQPDIPIQSTIKLAISYIHFDSSCPASFKPHDTMTIIHILLLTIETDVDLSDAVSSSEETLLEYNSVILPWLWRASHHGIQSDFVQNMVKLP